MNCEFFSIFLCKIISSTIIPLLNSKGGINMEDLGMTAKLFETSSNLQLASIWLKRIVEGEQVDSEGKEVLTWTGKFLYEVDWSSKIPQKTSVGGGLALQATSVRPTFYSSLIRIAPKFKEAGMKTEEEILNFLRCLYQNLLTLGAPGKGHKKLKYFESKLGALLLHEISESILIQINNNGFPRTSISLKDEWEPSRNEFNTVIS